MKTLYKVLILMFFFISIKSSAQYPPFNVTVNTSNATGYYYFCPYKLSGFPNFPAGTQNHMILDHNGHVVYYRPMSGYFAGDFKQQRNGLISYAANNKFYLMDSTFTIVDSVTTQGGVIFDLHELQILPNGHYLILGDEDHTHQDLSSYHMFYNNGSPGSANATVTAGVVQELDSAKHVVFEWHSFNHFNFNDVDSFFLTDSTRVDWTHMNAIEMDSDGNILISNRHFDEITKINRSDSSIIWRMGGKRNQFTFVGDSIKFLAQHDIRRLRNGHITLFDNGRQSPLHPTSGKEYQLDETHHIATLVWSHGEGANVFSRSQGNNQLLHNGNRLISYGNIINENIVFNVVDTSGNKVFEISFPDSELTYRSFYYDTVRWLSKQPHITCYTDSTNRYLVADSGYSSYRWSNGATTQSITATANDTFYVYVPAGDSGFISSPIFIARFPSDPIASSSSHCGPGSVTLSANCPDPVYWYISPGGSIVGNGNNYTTPVLSSTTPYFAQSSNGACPGHTVEADAIINPIPHVYLGPDTVTATSYLIDAGAGFASYVWSNGATTQMITVSNTDTFCVTVTDTNSCSDSDCVFVDVANGISNLKGINSFSVYPNPSDGRITIEFSSAIHQADVEIRNVTGQIIKKISDCNSPVLNIDLTSVQKGIYFIRLISDGKAEMQRINIQ